MNKEIWKYSLIDVGNNTFEIPSGAKILTCQLQREVPTIWALVNPDAEKEERHFEVVGTGHDISKGIGGFSYINTVQLTNGIVLHIFEIIK